MIDQQLNTPPVPVSKSPLDKIRPIFNAYWLKFSQSKFYRDKRIFLSVCIFLGLVVLIVLIGLIFGGKKGTQIAKNTPTPTPVATGATNIGDDALSQIEQKLLDLKNQITALDVKQSRLQPPSLDFKVKF